MTGRLFGAAPLSLLILLAAVLAGCEPPTTWRKTDSVPIEQQQAERRSQAGDYAGAAALYESAAATQSGDRRTGLLLAAAANYIRARDLRSAENVMRQLQRPRRGELAVEYRVVEGELALARGDGAGAYRALGAPPEPSAPPSLRLRYYRTMAGALATLGRPVAEADARMRLADLATDPGERNANQQQLLRLLAPLSQNQRFAVRQLGHPHAQGWIALADALYGSYSDAVDRDLRYRDWRIAFPNHPAFRSNGGAEGFSLPVFTTGVGLNIGVLLPSGGPYIRAADLIREGIMAGVFSLPPETRPAVRFYDSDRAPAPQVYKQAVDEGANLVIGPLTKEAVSALKQSGLFGVPVIALNHTEDLWPAPHGLFQFALSPEEEGRQIAERAIQEGFRSAAVLAPADAWGARYVEGFRQHWEAMGGFIATVTEYDPDQHHFAEPIRQALGAGADYIYIVGKPLKARQLRTQIQYFGSATTPVFVPSRSVQDTRRPAANLDLDGAWVPAMPWVLVPETGEGDEAAGPVPDGGGWGEAPPIESIADPLQAVRDGATRAGEGYGEFIAMGFDALQLAINLQPLSAGYTGLDGATGYLTMDAAGIVRRRPAWITFDNGRPRLLGY